MFLENGYSSTTFRMLADELDISAGHVAFYFSSKDALLAELVGILCKFQWEMMKDEADDGISALLAVCLELAVMAAVCEEDAVAKEFFISSYRSDICLELIQKNDTERAKEVFAEFCPDWSDAQFEAAETIVSGIEYSTLNSSGKSDLFEERITAALNTIMSIYNVPEETRRVKLEKVFAMDFRAIGNRIFKEFKDYVELTNEQAFEKLI